MHPRGGLFAEPIGNWLGEVCTGGYDIVGSMLIAALSLSGIPLFIPAAERVHSMVWYSALTIFRFAGIITFNSLLRCSIGRKLRMRKCAD